MNDSKVFRQSNDTHQTNMIKPKIVLASSSKYRKSQLGRLPIEFETRSPNINEVAEENESPSALARRLAYEKATIVSNEYKDQCALIIGCDQVAQLNKTCLGKPGNFDAAREQLLLCSGQTLTFLSALCLYNTETKQIRQAIVPTQVTFRQLSEKLINQTLKLDEPFDCAGAFKSEAAGIMLLEKITSDDPSALIGLPLIQLIKMLSDENAF